MTTNGLATQQDTCTTLKNAVVVVIESDDECNDNCLSEEHKKGLQSFRTILPFLSDQKAREVLLKAHWNVERAVNLCFAEAATTDHNHVDERRREEEDKKIAFREDRGKKREHELCQQWHSIVRQCKETAFSDPDFPPSTSSIDGRSRTDIGTAPSCVRCRCGYIATPKQVQSDGPNFGRFYLACGQGQRRTPAPDNPNDDQSRERKSQQTAIRNPYAKKQTTTARPSQYRCNFFQWDATGSSGGPGYGGSRLTRFEWKNLGMEKRCVLYRKSFGTSQVRQGSVGNCWFLSALAVVAEKPHLIHRIMPHESLNASGCYQVNLFLDGTWQPVIVDSNLPVLIQKRGKAARDERQRGGISLDESTVALPAFCAAPDYQLWAPLVEKAYAKAHGSYQMLSGGFIQEGLQDLTGAPTETVVFQSGLFDQDTFWARLLSFSSAGFLMGVATAHGGEGLVGSHAYSVLDVIDLHDCVIGEQSKLTDFFGGKRRKVERRSIRLVQIRNPWGKREWSGEWSASSETWTRTLRARLGNERTFAKGEGTFFMSYEDMLSRFHHMDIAMTRKNWVNCDALGRFDARKDPLQRSSCCYALKVTETTSAILSVIQPKKRANTKSSSWYCDPSFIVCSRHRGGSWEREIVMNSGIRRQNHAEVTLRQDREYFCLPFSSLCGTTETVFPFRLAAYSNNSVAIEPVAFDGSGVVAELHKSLLSKEVNLVYPMGSGGRLVCVHGEDCAYFLAVNGFSDMMVTVKLSFKLPSGLVASAESIEYDLPPSTQGVCAIVGSNGRRSAATEFSFHYMVSTSKVSRNGVVTRPVASKLYSTTILSVAGDLLTSNSQVGDALSGTGMVETYHWIPQVGNAKPVQKES